MHGGVQAVLPQPAMPRPQLAARAGANEELRVEASVDRVREEWDDLASRLGASPFLRPGWIAAWWHAFGHGTLELRTFRRRGRLSALLPTVREAGVVRSAMNCHSPQFDLLAEDAGAALALARGLFAAAPRRVAIASLEPVGLGMGALRRAAEEAGYRVLVRPYQRSPYLAIDGDWPAFQSRFSRNLRTDLRRSRRRLEARGRLEVEICENRNGLRGRLSEAFAVEASSWKGRRGTAIRSRRDTLRFYARIARWAADHGSLRLFLLRFDGRALAMYLTLEQDGVCHLVKGGYDPSFGRYSPGKLLLEAVIARAFATGLERVELHGGAETYKLRWTKLVAERELFEAFSPSPAGRLAWLLAAGRPAVRRLLGRAGFELDATQRRASCAATFRQE